jgi:signal transduction histidine kinase
MQVGAIPMSTDTPEPAHSELRVRELEREIAALNEFLSTLGHELRNPLAPIVMQAQYLLEVAQKSKGGSISADWLCERQEAFCNRLLKFVGMLNRIMDISRLNAGRLDLELEPVDASEVVREAGAVFERELNSARSVLRIEAPPSALGFWDRLRLSQIVTNLLSNAVRYGAGKPITVGIEADAEWLRLSVRDEGIGIAAEDQQRIFRRFERAQGHHSGGFGIGLWIVSETCRAMGGTVEVESSPGRGSTFIVNLPKHPNGAMPAGAAHSSSA